MENREDYSVEGTLIVPEIVNPTMTPEEGKETADTITAFVRSYGEKGVEVPDGDWLLEQFKVSLPDKDEAELTQMRDEIIDGLNQQEEAKKSLETALSRGMSKESWFARECKKAASGMSAMESAKYLQGLDDAVKTANDELLVTIMTKGGSVNQNPHLDGFIAEQYHAQTFNLNAEATGSKFRAEVLKPEGTTYGENSVDIVIKDTTTGRIVRRYQSKYGETAVATKKLFDNGDYRGQRKLAPEEQVGKLGENFTDRIEAPDGTTSVPLTKEKAVTLQEEAQSGKWNDLNWNDYQMKDIAVGIAKNTARAGAQGLLIGAGFELARQICSDEEIDGEKLVEVGLTSGVDFGVKTAVAGGLKTAAEKGVISILPKGISGNVCTGIAFTAIENVKVLGQVASGELTPHEGLEKAEQVTASCVCGLMTAAKGAAIGATVGTVLGPIGTAVGGFVGGTIGYIAGSSIAEKVTKGLQKVRKVVVEDVIKPALEKAKEVVHEAWEGVKSVGRSIARFFGF